MFVRILPLCAVLLAAGAPAQAQELETQQEKFSYTMGYQMGLSLQRPGMELDHEIVVQALQEALSGEQPRLSRNEMDEAIAAQRAKLESDRQEKAAGNLARGEEFLQENGQREEVTETESGLQYEVITEGDGAQPTTDDTVVVHYEGTHLDGSVFDSSYERGNPATLPLNGVIAGWQEGLQLMKEGAKYKLYVPADLAYGENGAGQRIEPNETLVFEVELLEIK
ncbi:MAG TPA: FKBP-type peptidyl-prolyl cis-trans isomerase [Arenicellales bacterium]|nr:FKBP-type peptidyl-prolyl cis-trans isomerase [Arenicellales bacterium]